MDKSWFTASETLTLAADRVESGWCIGTYARDIFGSACSSSFGDGVQFCAVGAIRQAAHDTARRDKPDTWLDSAEAGMRSVAAAACLARHLTESAGHIGSIESWNDRAVSGAAVADGMRAAAAAARDTAWLERVAGD